MVRWSSPCEMELSVSAGRRGEMDLSVSAGLHGAPLHHSLTTTATGYRHWPVLCVELPAARYAQNKTKHADFAHCGLFAHIQCAFGMAD